MTHHDEGLARHPSTDECREAIMLWKKEVMRLEPKGLEDLESQSEKQDFVFPY